MKYICKICEKEFNKEDNLVRFIAFPKDKSKKVFDSEKDFFVICKEDIKKIVQKLADITTEKDTYNEHFFWFKKEEELLKIAKEIYSKCKCYDKKIKDLSKLDDKVYDLMCEECWTKFRKKTNERNTNSEAVKNMHL